MTYSEDFKKALLSKPHVILGKNGITDQFITHIKNLIKKQKIIKIKVLKSALQESNIDEIANEVSNATDSFLLDVRGNKIILSQNPIKKK